MLDQSDLILADRFTQGMGLLDISLTDLRTRLAAPLEDEIKPWRFHSITSRFHDALTFLATLTFPASRHVAFATRGNGTALINNGRDGSDYGDYTYQLPRRVRTRMVWFVDNPGRVWTRGDKSEILQYEARIFALHGPDGELVRAVLCMDDGDRWTFTTQGTPHAIEATFPYGARRKTDRFTQKHLRELTQAYGFHVPGGADFIAAGQYLLFTEDHGRPLQSCTLDEADDPAYGYYLRALGFARHMDTHASSVIADLERCLELNPVYGPRVEAILSEARRKASRTTE